MNPLDVAFLILGSVGLALLIYLKFEEKHQKDKNK
jgi:hypothetical protein